MPIRIVSGKVTVTRGGEKKVVPPNTPFNFTKAELESVKKFDPNLVHTPSETEARGVRDFGELPGRSGSPAPKKEAKVAEPKSEPAKDEDEDTVYTDDELEAMTIPGLKQLATDRDLEIPSNANKGTLKGLILEDQEKGDL